jgi:hypothetical protein
VGPVSSSGVRRMKSLRNLPLRKPLPPSPERTPGRIVPESSTRGSETPLPKTEEKIDGRIERGVPSRTDRTTASAYDGRVSSRTETETARRADEERMSERIPLEESEQSGEEIVRSRAAQTETRTSQTSVSRIDRIIPGVPVSERADEEESTRTARSDESIQTRYMENEPHARDDHAEVGEEKIAGEMETFDEEGGEIVKRAEEPSSRSPEIGEPQPVRPSEEKGKVEIKVEEKVEVIKEPVETRETEEAGQPVPVKGEKSAEKVAEEKREETVTQSDVPAEVRQFIESERGKDRESVVASKSHGTVSDRRIIAPRPEDRAAQARAGSQMKPQGLDIWEKIGITKKGLGVWKQMLNNVREK